jgi:hypothetical protein
MHRTLSERFPYLTFIETPAGSEGGNEGTETPKTFTQEEVNSFLAKELAPLREQIKTLKPAAEKLAQIEKSQKSEIEKLVEATKAESQKAIEAALAERDEISKQFEDFKRDTVLSKIPEDKREAFKDKSAAEIESALALASVLTPPTPKIPTPLFGGGSADGKNNGINGTEAAARATAAALLKQARS